jgi:hypothetical protein
MALDVCISHWLADASNEVGRPNKDGLADRGYSRSEEGARHRSAVGPAP